MGSEGSWRIEYGLSRSSEASSSVIRRFVAPAQVDSASLLSLTGHDSRTVGRGDDFRLTYSTHIPVG